MLLQVCRPVTKKTMYECVFLSERYVQLRNGGANTLGGTCYGYRHESMRSEGNSEELATGDEEINKDQKLCMKSRLRWLTRVAL